MHKDIKPPIPVGFIGLDGFGTAIAKRLSEAGFRVNLFDPDGDRARRTAATLGCETTPSLAQLALHTRVLIVRLGDSADIRYTLLSDQNLVSHLTHGSVVFDMNHGSPTATRELALELAEIGVTLIDAPFFGSVDAAATGQLSILAAGDDRVFPRCLPLLQLLGEVRRLGDAGSAHAFMALHGYLSASAVASLAEALMTAKRFGLDLGCMFEALQSLSDHRKAGRWHESSLAIPDLDKRLEIGAMVRDLARVDELVRATGGPAALLEACTEMLKGALAELGCGAGLSAIVNQLASHALPFGARTPPQTPPW